MSNHPGIFQKKTKNGIHYQVKWRRSDGSQASKTFRLKKEAVAFKTKLAYEKNRGFVADDRRANMTFREYAKEVFASLNHGPSTIRRRDGIMSKYLLPAFGEKKINCIHLKDIQREVNAWRDAGLSPYSINNHLGVLGPIFKSAFNEDLIMKSPLTGVKRPRPTEVQGSALTSEECHDLLAAIDERYQYLIHFALATGARWGEIESLKIRDFQPLKNLVVIRNSKTEAGIREIPLDPEDTERIARHIADTGRNGADGDSPLFTSPNGQSLHHSNFRKRIFKPACDKAGLHGIVFHDLRRTHATMLVAEGHDVKVVQERMGHKDITTTLKYYAKATNSGRAKASGTKNRYLRKSNQQLLEEAN
jgi:integrase